MWQPAAILYPDVELLLSRELGSALASRWQRPVYVGTTVPNPRREYMVTVRSDGGPDLGDVRSLCRVGINVYGPTPQQATDLARLIGALLGGMAGKQAITAVTSVSLPTEIADPSKTPRRYLTAEIHVRGSALA
ncbi:hypothetical protein [Nocardioides alcanivorans]|uniref:hypothetical protein n=1 Tax=Nocardioides alcanivorans TaxID=2897352 RepID=UPI001F1C9FA7|nr:hypothetical protein [Nocardioides alcanivorans]